MTKIKNRRIKIRNKNSLSAIPDDVHDRFLTADRGVWHPRFEGPAAGISRERARYVHIYMVVLPGLYLPLTEHNV